jgi:hypothetical protein
MDLDVSFEGTFLTKNFVTSGLPSITSLAHMQCTPRDVGLTFNVLITLHVFTAPSVTTKCPPPLHLNHIALLYVLSRDLV